MRIQSKGELGENIRRSELFFIGDVRDVIHSRAARVRPLPELRHGLGACGTQDPATAGESIVVRGCCAATLPNEDAGIKIEYRASSQGFHTPFFLGWNGEPSLVTDFISDTGVTLNQIYQSIFTHLRRLGPPWNFEYVFIELIGLFKPHEISDRALQRPVDRGDVLTTTPEHAGSFFKSRIIYNDLVRRGESLEDLFPLCVVGVGHFRGASAAGNKALSERIFYRPPQIPTAAPAHQARDIESDEVRTHNHALGWRGETSFAGRLLETLLSQSRSEAETEACEPDLEELLSRRPDYLIHLDDWSVVTAAAVKIYLAPEQSFNIQPA